MTDELDEVSCVMSDEETVKAYKKLCRKLEQQAQRWRTVADGLAAALSELSDIVEDARRSGGARGIDTFTVQPANAALAAYEQAKKEST